MTTSDAQAIVDGFETAEKELKKHKTQLTPHTMRAIVAQRITSYQAAKKLLTASLSMAMIIDTSDIKKTWSYGDQDAFDKFTEAIQLAAQFL